MQDYVRGYTFDRVNQRSVHSGTRDITLSCWSTIYMNNRHASASAPTQSAAHVASTVRFVLDPDAPSSLLSTLDTVFDQGKSPAATQVLEAVRIATNTTLAMHIIDSEADDLPPVIRNSLTTASLYIHRSEAYRAGTLNPHVAQPILQWELAHNHTPARATRLASAATLLLAMSHGGKLTVVGRQDAAQPAVPPVPRPTTDDPPDQPATKRQRVAAPAANLQRSSSLPIANDTDVNDFEIEDVLPIVMPKEAEQHRLEINGLSGGWSDLSLVIAGEVYCLFNSKLPNALPTEDLGALIQALRHGAVTFTAEGVAGDRLNVKDLSVDVSWFGGQDISLTVQKVLAQVFQQLILNQCPRLILSNWDAYLLIRLGEDRQVHVSRLFHRDPLQRLDPMMVESPLELLLSLQLLSTRLYQAKSCMSKIWAAECLEPVDPIWRYDGSDWFYTDSSTPSNSSHKLASRSSNNSAGGRSRTARGGNGGQGRVAKKNSTGNSSGGAGAAGSTGNASNEATDNLDDARDVSLVSNGDSIEAAEDAIHDNSFASTLTMTLNSDLKRAHLIPALESLTTPLECILQGNHPLGASHLHILLGEELSGGRTGLGFRTQVDNIPLVAKVVDMSDSSPLWFHPDCYDTAKAIMRQVWTECRMYTWNLERFKAASSPDFMVSLLGDAGAPLGGDFSGPAPQLAPYANDVRAAYKALRHVGVLHGDVAPRHILVRNGRVRIIDFEASQGLVGGSPYLQAESDKVETMLANAETDAMAGRQTEVVTAKLKNTPLQHVRHEV